MRKGYGTKAAQQQFQEKAEQKKESSETQKDASSFWPLAVLLYFGFDSFLYVFSEFRFEVSDR